MLKHPYLIDNRDWWTSVWSHQSQSARREHMDKLTALSAGASFLALQRAQYPSNSIAAPTAFRSFAELPWKSVWAGDVVAPRGLKGMGVSSSSGCWEPAFTQITITNLSVSWMCWIWAFGVSQKYKFTKDIDWLRLTLALCVGIELPVCFEITKEWKEWIRPWCLLHRHSLPCLKCIIWTFFVRWTLDSWEWRVERVRVFLFSLKDSVDTWYLTNNIITLCSHTYTMSDWHCGWSECIHTAKMKNTGMLRSRLCVFSRFGGYMNIMMKKA